jgi:hypothetical protein
MVRLLYVLAWLSLVGSVVLAVLSGSLLGGAAWVAQGVVSAALLGGFGRAIELLETACRYLAVMPAAEPAPERRAHRLGDTRPLGRLSTMEPMRVSEGR